MLSKQLLQVSHAFRNAALHFEVPFIKRQLIVGQ